MRHRGRALASLALVLLLTGCPVGSDRAGPDPAAPSGAADGGVDGEGRRDRVDVPEPSPTPPPAPAVPLTTLEAGVPLLERPADTGVITRGAVSTPDGGALVLLASPDRQPLRLVTVDGARQAAVRSVPVPDLALMWDVHLLPDGQVLVSGEFRQGERGYGYVTVDPRTGRGTHHLVIPYEEGTSVAHGRSVLSPGGDTLYLFLSSFVEDRRLNLLVAADVASGRQLAGRDLFEEVRDVSTAAIQPFSIWLFPRPQGGVQLLFDGFPTDSFRIVPTLLRYDDDLEPVGRPAQLTQGQQSAETQAAAMAADGTIYVSAETLDGGVLLSVPPGGTSGTRVLELAGHTFDYALAVDPEQRWVLLPDVRGVRAVELSTGAETPVDIGCLWGLQVRDIRPGNGAGALLLGQCGNPSSGTPFLWFTGP
jgi:hypothetical protein